MLIITRETDYAIRILRALSDGRLHTAPQLSRDEQLPNAFTYKIIKKLEKADIIEVIRGNSGGCRLKAQLSDITLYDVISASGDQARLSSCTSPGYECTWRECYGECAVHGNLMRIQEKLEQELKSYSIEDILTRH